MFLWSVSHMLSELSCTIIIRFTYGPMLFLLFGSLWLQTLQQCHNVIWATLELFIWARSMPKGTCCLGHISRYLELFWVFIVLCGEVDDLLNLIAGPVRVLPENDPLLPLCRWRQSYKRVAGGGEHPEIQTV